LDPGFFRTVSSHCGYKQSRRYGALADQLSQFSDSSVAGTEHTSFCSLVEADAWPT
jgi:hypothetical protein